MRTAARVGYPLYSLSSLTPVRIPSLGVLLVVACSFDIEPVATPQDGGSSGAAGGPGGNGGAAAGSGGSAATGGAAGAGGSVTPPSVRCSECATTECVCAPVAPSGWATVVVAETDDASSVACPEGYGFQEVLGRTPANDGCDPCSCGQATQTRACDPAFYNDTTCTDANASGGPVLESGECQRFAPGVHFTYEESGTCEGPFDAARTPRWEQTASICTALVEGGGCTAGGCVPSPPPPFADRRCILSDAMEELACPPGFPNRTVYYADFSDGRTCEGCSCQFRGCMGGQIRFCATDTCGSCQTSAFEGCHDGTAIRSVQVVIPPDSVCVPSGTPTLMGTLTGRNPRTVCCQ